jgi:hypothetical protein
MSDFKDSVKVATIGHVVVSGGAPNNVNGIMLGKNNRVLVWKQNPPSGKDFSPENGVYRVEVVGTGNNGTWVRAEDMDEGHEISSGNLIYVENGVYGKKWFTLSSIGNVLIGVSGLKFEVYPLLSLRSKILVNGGRFNGNQYQTIAQAYDACKDDTSTVMLLVGVGSFGDLTLAADWNPYVKITGVGKDSSVIGAINTSGYNISLSLANVYISSITADGGSIAIDGTDIRIDDVNSKNYAVGAPQATISGSGVHIVSLDVSTNVADAVATNVVIGDGVRVDAVSTRSDAGTGGSVVLGNHCISEGYIDTSGAKAPGSVATGRHFTGKYIRCNSLGSNSSSATVSVGAYSNIDNAIYATGSLSGTLGAPGGSVTLRENASASHVSVVSYAASGTIGPYFRGYSNANVGSIDAYSVVEGGTVFAERMTIGSLNINFSGTATTGSRAALTDTRVESIEMVPSAPFGTVGSLRLDGCRINGPIQTGVGASVVASDCAFSSSQFNIDAVASASKFTQCTFDSPISCIPEVTVNDVAFVNCVMRPGPSGLGYRSIDAASPVTVRAYNLVHNSGFGSNVTVSDGYEVVPPIDI